MRIPYIPEDAPFSGDQRAWLAGFLAGLHSRHAIGGTAVAPAAEAKPAQVLNVLFGSQTGNAEAMAETAAKSARAMGFDARLAALDDVGMADLAAMSRVIVVCSTYGEGEMPDNAQLFWEALSGPMAPRLEQVQFAVLALGDTGYDGFCQAGKLIDVRLEQLGAHRLTARADCDVDYEEPAEGWLGATLPLLSGTPAAAPAPVATEKTGWSRKNPYAARIAINRRLSGKGSVKEIRHYVFDLGASGLIYEAGDALGVMPRNDPDLAAQILAAVGATPETPGADDRPLIEALIERLEIVTPSRELIQAVEVRAGNDELSHVLKNGDREALEAWLWGRDTLDLLRLMPARALEAVAFAALLKPLQHRAYSISSSPKASPGSVHLTVASVRYETGGRVHGGVCSTFLADRAGDTAGVFVSPNKSFRVPVDDRVPMIMVGPGTGIAPFRAFLQERQARGAAGKNWLFFGDQHRASDFIYDA